MKAMRKIVGTALLAGSLGLGAVAAAPPAHAETFQRCLAAARWSHYAADRMGSSDSFGEWNFWYTEWLNNESWTSDNCF